MVDTDRVLRLLRAISLRVRDLDEERFADAETRASARWLNGVKYLFVTAIEGTLDVAHHIIASEGWGSPDTNAAAFATLARRAVITDAVAGAMASAAGFRNILVHQYATVDDGKVIDFLDRLQLLDDFVADVSTWIEQQPPSG